MLEPRYRAVFLVNALAVAAFSILFFTRKNYEFILYIAVIIFFVVVILKSRHKVDYPQPVLWGLTLWAILHMAGGGVYLNGKSLYSTMLLPIVGEPYWILKYDQIVHVIGFGVATLVAFYVLKPSLKQPITHWLALSIVVVMAGVGLGAVNEIVEFAATVMLPETGVGGYENTSIDLVANLIGAILAMGYLKIAES